MILQARLPKRGQCGWWTSPLTSGKNNSRLETQKFLDSSTGKFYEEIQPNAFLNMCQPNHIISGAFTWRHSLSLTPATPPIWAVMGCCDMWGQKRHQTPLIHTDTTYRLGSERASTLRSSPTSTPYIPLNRLNCKFYMAGVRCLI